MSMIPVTSVAAPHAATHYAGGSDQITGQSLSGLRTVDSPTFAALTTTGSVTVAGLATIDSGSGAHGLSTAGVGIFLSAADSTGTGVKTATFGSAAGTTISSWNIGGTRASQSATLASSGFVQLIARGHDGSASTGSQASYGIFSDGLWSGSNRGAYHSWRGTPSGSTAEAEWMRLYRGILYVYGAVPGTPAAGQVLIGGGEIKTAGAATFGGETQAPVFAAYTAASTGSDTFDAAPRNGVGSDNGGAYWQLGSGYHLDLWQFNSGWNRTLRMAKDGVATFSGTIVTSGNVRAGLIELGSGGELRLPGYDGDTDIAVNYTGYNGGTTRFRSVKFYDGKQALIATLDGATKTATFSGKLVFGAGSYSAGSAQAYTTATDGLYIIGKAGSSTDLVLTNGAGGTILDNPTGTITARFAGLVKAAGSTDEQLRIGQSATIDSYGYQIGRQSAAGSNLGFLTFYGPQSGYGGYAFRNADKGDLLRLANDGTATFYGSAALGTPGSNQVLIGGGEVKASAAITTVGFVADNGTLNSVSHYSGSANTDEKWWRWQNGSAVGSGVLRLRALNDALTDGINALTFSRTGISSVTVTFGGFVNIAGCSSTPGSSGAAGALGDIRFDSSYIYICTATNTWKRAAISTW